MKFENLESERLILRRFEDRDLDNFVGYRADPDVARYQGWEDFTITDGKRFIAEMASAGINIPDSWFQVALALKDSNQLIGDLAVHTLEDPRQMEVGFTLSSQVQGQGYAAEALRRMLDYLFVELDKHRVIAITDAENLAAQRLLTKLCFRREGEFVENIWFKGSWGSEYLYAMLQREWIRLTR